MRGTPTKETWPGLTDLPDYIAYETYAPQPLRGIFTAAGDDLLLLLERLLSLNPLTRCTASEALQVNSVCWFCVAHNINETISIIQYHS